VVWVAVPTAVQLGRDILRGVVRRLRHAEVAVRLSEGWKLPDKLEPAGRGLITLVGAAAQLKAYGARGAKVVNLSRMHDPKTLGVPSVLMANHAAGRLAAGHLLSLGCRRLTVLGVGDTGFAGLRTEGLAGAVAEANARMVPANHALGLRLPGSRNKRLAALRAWARRVPTPIGVMLVQDVLAKDVLPALRQAGRDVPADVALIGINNDELMCESLDPPLSSVDLNGERIGHEAAGLMLRLLGGEPPPAEPIVVPPRGVVRRQSTGMVSSEDPLVARALAHMHRNLATPLSVQGLADTLNVSKRKLERTFQTELHQTPAAFWRSIRLDHAAHLLNERDAPLDQIALASGFTSLQHFSQAFKDAHGLPPGEYRKQRRAR